ncbi:hypothetical protein VULLAG_LOCUS21042 [Vulpes lagopus]
MIRWGSQVMKMLNNLFKQLKYQSTCMTRLKDGCVLYSGHVLMDSGRQRDETGGCWSISNRLKPILSQGGGNGHERWGQFPNLN